MRAPGAGPQATKLKAPAALQGPVDEFPGGHRSRVTPVPIPNTEVKLATADGTAWVTAWESRSLPGLFSTTSPLLERAAGFFCGAIHSQTPAQAPPALRPRRRSASSRDDRRSAGGDWQIVTHSATRRPHPEAARRKAPARAS